MPDALCHTVTSHRTRTQVTLCRPQDAHDKNQHIPQPTPEMFYREDTAPSGEEFIEEFAGALRQRNLPTEFLLWYGEKSDEDPEAYPMALQRKEWLEQFAAFLDDLKE